MFAVRLLLYGVSVEGTQISSALLRNAKYSEGKYEIIEKFIDIAKVRIE